jgi:Peptidase family M1 domain
MRIFCTILFCCLTACFHEVFAQPYFQQHVDYTIEVTLDDKNHFLHGHETFVYTNHSRDTMDVLYIHLWPNAYKNAKSALAKQKMSRGDFFLLYAGESDRGYIDSLAFNVDGIDVEMQPHKGFEDIVIINLPKSIGPGQHVVVSTPFRVKLPSGSISRLGHIGESYQITQWYPKPAVYDLDGWHEMPYLNQGEFYSEFGSFDVKITLPSNYTVGATGDLQTREELDRMDSLARLPLQKNVARDASGNLQYPESSSRIKTLHYKQQNVHDFGWFADKTWNVRKGEATLPHSKRKVTTWALFTPSEAAIWEKSALQAINDGLYYYSLWSGDYPYNQCTAVDGTISAGGGMEYPNVTVIGNSGSESALQTVIIHEVGHNWFYGILGSNERDNAWMDEGINSFFETRTILATNPDKQKLDISIQGIDIDKALSISDLSYQYITEELAYLITARNYADQPMQLPSDYFSDINYGAIVYKKSALAFNYLMNYLGEEMMNACMAAYFEEWKFKHPQPENLQAVFERVSNKDLSWFFDRLINTKERVEYKLIRAKFDAANGKSPNQIRVKVKNNGEIAGPFSVDVVRDGALITRKWFDGIQQLSTRVVEMDGQKGDDIKINNAFGIPEYKRSNNLSRTSGIFRKIEPLHLNFLTGVDHPEKSQIFWAPIAGWNNYNKWMIGALLHNTTLPKQDFSWRIAPMYSPSTNWLNGYALIEKDNGKVACGIRAQRFAFSNFYIKDTHHILGYRLISPFVRINIFPKRFKKDWTGFIQAEWFFIRGKFSRNQGIELQSFAISANNLPNQGEANVMRIQGKASKKMLRSRLDLKTDLQSGELLDWGIMLQTEASFDYIYRGKGKRHWSTRAYIGLTNGELPLSASGQNGNNDYLYDGHMLGRTEYTGILSRQYLPSQGGLFLPSGADLQSREMLISLRSQWEAPFRLPLALFAGAAAVNQERYILTAGIALPIIRNIFEVYVPLVHGDRHGIESLHEKVLFRDLITFQLNIDMANPFNLIKKLH